MTQKKKVLEVAETVVQRRSTLVDYVWEKWEKKVRIWAIGRLLKTAGYRWKRMRKSCQFRRDEGLFRFFEKEIQLLKQLEDKGEIELFFYDEAGFNLTPVVPYGWQKIGTTQAIPSTQGGNSSVMGLISRKGGFRYELRNKAPKAQDIIDFIDQMEVKKKTIIVMDQAPTHTAKLFKERIKSWKEKNLYVQCLPA